MIDKKLLKNIDWVLVIFFGLLLAFSLIILASASSNMGSAPYYYFKRQLLWIFVGMCVFVGVALFDYRQLERGTKYIYIAMLVMLIGVLLVPADDGVHRWYDLKVMMFQPSELAKIITIVCFSSFLVNMQNKLHEWRTFFLSLALVGVPMLLVLIEPDLGTSLAFGMILLAMMWQGGIPRRRMIGFVIIILLMVVFVYVDLYFSSGGFAYAPEELMIPLPLKTYQLMRLIIFINPYMDPLNTGYHIIQSQVAIGSGGLIGKGWGAGSQVQNNFLPEHHTDFIFAVVGEEFGLLGAILLLAIYAVIILRCIRIALTSDDLFGKLIVSGVVMMLVFQIFTNIGMTIGIMPITGLPLPFMSYGGTSMLMNMISMGLVMSVALRRERTIF